MSQIPTKSDLFSNSLVVIDSQHKKITINTRSIALELDKRNGDLNKKVRYLIKNGLIDAGKLSLTYYLDSSSRKQKSYDLDEESALQLVMSLSGKKAELLHKKIAVSFIQMKAELHKWRKARQTVIEPTSICNDSIEWLRLALIEEIPESRKPKFLYINIQSAITKAAAQNARTGRDEMTANQLKSIQWLEAHVHEEIERLRGLEFSAVEIRKHILHILKAGCNEQEEVVTV